MKRIYGLVILALSVANGISAMEVLTVHDVVEAYKAGRHEDKGYTPIELQAVARSLNKDYVFAKIAEIELQDTDSSFDGIEEALALLWILEQGGELKQHEMAFPESSLKSIRSEKKALLKAAAGPTAKELGRQRRAELEKQKTMTINQLVKTAVAYFNQNGRESTFALISNPNGPFVKGDIYMFAYDMQGIAVAHGQNAALLGQNLIDLQDSRGNPIIRDLIEVGKTKGSGWTEYYLRNEFKRSYVEKVTDPKTQTDYIISAGYYPK